MGTRLREETEFIPKPMVEIGGRPILWHIMKIYSFFGHNDFVLCLGYKGDIIRRYFIEYDVLNCDVTVDLGTKEIIRHDRVHDEANWRVTLVETGADTMTGGRIERALRYVEDDTFFATYGDAVADIDVRSLLAFHKDQRKVATLVSIQPPARFGRVEFDASGVVARGFAEKPEGGDGWVNGGFFVFDRRIGRYLNGSGHVLEQGALVQLATEGQLAVYCHHGYWQCMDTLRDVETLRQAIAGGRAPWLRGTDGMARQSQGTVLPGAANP